MVGVTPGATLLLSPPSLTSSPTGPATIASLRTDTTDLQMLDRVVEGLALLPAEAYSAVIFAPGNPGEVEGYLSAALEKIWNATKAEGVVRIGKIAGEQIKGEALLKGWIVGGEGEEFTLTKPASTTAAAVPLRLRKKTGGAAKAKKLAFLNFDTSDDLINENDLLTESDLAKPVVQPAECLPAPGKRRKACKDCTCGLAEKEAADAAAAEDARKAVTLGVDDLAEIDFTKQGKVVSSCGNCALGDAFRCSGCPYLGMPAFAEAEKGTVEMSWGDDI